jgi:hypothetical protein
MNDLLQPCLSEIFNEQSQTNPPKLTRRKGTKSTLPVSIRVTVEEKARLQTMALSLAVQMGELEASAEVENALKQACEEIHDIRNTLIIALGIKPQEHRR